MTLWAKTKKRNNILASSPKYFFRKKVSKVGALDVPILLQLKPIEGFSFVVAPQFSYLLKERNVYTFGSNSSAQEAEFANIYCDFCSRWLGFSDQ
jgi:hypothetical protein